jgi:hypothetical protein
MDKGSLVMTCYALLLGARSNSGDHLIGKRIIDLFELCRPDVELLRFDRWLPVEDRLDELNNCNAVILAGGPAFQPTLYPGIYPLVDDLRKIRVPVIAFGLGWKGHPGDKLTEQLYRFTPDSRPLLDRLRSQNIPVSCRDPPTVRILARQGVSNTVMTGDPAWYDREFLEQDFTAPETITKIALSVPANLNYIQQANRLAAGLLETFPSAEIIPVFHHGWNPGDGMTDAAVEKNRVMKSHFEDSGFRCVDISGDYKKLEKIYSDVDLHVGYRLHAHLFRLSRRIPSFLLHEDGRGIGGTEALKIEGVNAWSRPVSAWLGGQFQRTPVLGRYVCPKISGHVHESQTAASRMCSVVRGEAMNDFHGQRHVASLIDHTYRFAMKPFVASLP